MAATPEVLLARKLASNELQTRQKAEKSLKKWLSTKAREGMREIEMKRLWKGLFACMYMSDKPLVQEQLATDLSSLMHLFSDYNLGTVFCKIFYETMANEWISIDRLRLDKFYMFIRSFTNETFVYLNGHNWPESSVKCIMKCIAGLHDSCPGIVLHVSELLLPELSTVRTKVPETQSILFLEPWIEVAAVSRDKSVVQSIEKGILRRLSKGHKIKNLTINWSQLADTVWEVSSQTNVLTRNRKMLHNFHRQIIDNKLITTSTEEGTVLHQVTTTQ